MSSLNIKGSRLRQCSGMAPSARRSRRRSTVRSCATCSSSQVRAALVSRRSALSALVLLEAAGVAAAMIDAELAYFHPKPDDDPQGTRVAEQALAAVAPVYAAAGIERLLLPRVIERPRHLDLVHATLPGARLQIAWLEVPMKTIAARLAAREVGSALDWHLRRAEEIRSNAVARELFDFTVNGDRTVQEVSADVLAHAGWLPRR